MFDAQAWFARDVILGKISLPTDVAAIAAEVARWQKAEDDKPETDEAAIRYQAEYVQLVDVGIIEHGPAFRVYDSTAVPPDPPGQSALLSGCAAFIDQLQASAKEFPDHGEFTVRALLVPIYMPLSPDVETHGSMRKRKIWTHLFQKLKFRIAGVNNVA